MSFSICFPRLSTSWFRTNSIQDTDNRTTEYTGTTLRYDFFETEYQGKAIGISFMFSHG